MNEFVQILVTIDTKEHAEYMAELLVKKRLSACVQILGPIVSTYWWEGEVEKSEEWLIFIKTRGELYDKVEKMVRDNHPYEVPEIVAIPIVEGSRDYLNWLRKETMG